MVKVGAKPTGLLPYLVLSAGLLLTVLTTYLLAQNQRLKVQQELESSVVGIENEIRTRINEYVALLRGGSGLFAVNRWVSDDEFRAYIERLRLPEFYPGMQGIGLAYRVTPENSAEFFARLRQQGMGNFKIWPSTNAVESFPIVYLEPLDDRNQHAVGFDMFSEPIRREAMIESRRLGAPVATRKVTLVQEISGPVQPGFLIYIPIFPSGKVPETEHERISQIEGFIYSPFRARDFLDPIFVKHRRDWPVDVEVYDSGKATAQNLVYRSDGVFDGAHFRATATIDVVGRKWLLKFRIQPALEHRIWQVTGGVAFIGSLLSFILFYFTYAESKSRRNLEETTSALRFQKLLFEALSDTLPDGVLVVSPDGKMQYMNRRLREIWHFPDFVTDSSPEATALEWASSQVADTQRFKTTIQDLYAKRTHGIHDEITFKDGRIFERFGAPLGAANQESYGWLWVFHDVTVPKRTEQRVRAYANQQAAVATLGSEALGEHDLQRILNRTVKVVADTLQVDACAVLELSRDREEFLIRAGIGWPEGTVGSVTVPGRAGSHAGATLLAGAPLKISDINRRTDLETPFLRAQGLLAALTVPITSDEGPYGILGIYSRAPREFSNDEVNFLQSSANLLATSIVRARVEQALRESEERFRLIVEQARDYGIFTLDVNGKVNSWNPGAQRILGFTSEEILGQQSDILFTPEDRQRGAAGEEIRIATEQGQALDERWHRRKDGTLFWSTGYTIALRDARGTLRGFAKIMRDITERKEFEQRIQRLNQELEERVQKRTAALQESYEQMETFTYTIAHDLRAPLRAMQGFSVALEEDYGDRLDDEGKNYLHRIAHSVERMDNLIQDLLAYSRLSRSDLSFQKVSIIHVLESVLQHLTEDIRAKDAEIIIERPLPLVVGHASTLEHIISNLVGNALKFTSPDNRPIIRIRADLPFENKDKKRFVRIWIEDNGIGIAPQYHDRVFNIFERLHGTTTFPGTGMGLAIVKKGVERMGGQIGLESAIGKGSRFWIELPTV